MTKKSKFYSFTITILMFVLMVVLADLFSSVITIGNFAFLSTQGIKSNSFTIYALSIDKCSTLSQASQVSNEAKLRGGAGYIHSQDGLYYVLLSAYENQNDALKVQENLLENEQSSELITINITEIVIDLSLNANEKTSIQDALSSFKNAYKNLYDFSVSIDTGVKTLSEIKLAVSSYLSDLNKTKTTFETVFLNKITSEIFKLKLKLTELVMTVNSFVEADYEQQVIYSSNLKETYIKCLIINKNLAKEMTA